MPLFAEPGLHHRQVQRVHLVLASSRRDRERKRKRGPSSLAWSFAEILLRKAASLALEFEIPRASLRRISASGSEEGERLFSRLSSTCTAIQLSQVNGENEKERWNDRGEEHVAGEKAASGMIADASMRSRKEAGPSLVSSRAKRPKLYYSR